MKENFIIREERHPVGMKVSDITFTLSSVIFILGAVGAVGAFVFHENYYVGLGIFNMGLFWQIVFAIVAIVTGLCSLGSYLCGFQVDGCHVRLECRATLSSKKKFFFTVNNREYSVNLRKIAELDMQMPCNIKNGMCFYACVPLEGGHKLVLVAQPGDATNVYILIDGVIVVEDGFVYVNKIEQIMSGSVATPTPAPRAIDTGVMPPFQTPSNSSSEKTVAPRTISYAIVGQAGVFETKKYDITSMLVLGRDEAECSVTFPSNTAGVSRVHCKLVVEMDGLYVYDLGSTYGTVVNNNKTLSANQKMKLKHGDTITIGSNQTFVVKEM